MSYHGINDLDDAVMLAIIVIGLIGMAWNAYWFIREGKNAR